ncbi:MAG: hypothetical protein V8R50_10865 [Clostridia bacterium]
MRSQNGIRQRSLPDQSFSENGLRVLAFAYKKIEEGLVPQLDDEQDLVFLGLISMMDPPREESKAAVAECIRAGISHDHGRSQGDSSCYCEENRNFKG